MGNCRLIVCGNRKVFLNEFVRFDLMFPVTMKRVPVVTNFKRPIKHLIKLIL